MGKYVKEKQILSKAVTFLSYLLPFYALFYFGAVSNGLFDPDSYTHAIRVERLLETGVWAETDLPDTSMPTHFTRALDIVFGLPALILSVFIPLESAVFLSCFLIPPLALFLFLRLAFKAYPEGRLLIGIFLFASRFMLNEFAFGYADNHAFIILFAAAALFALKRDKIKIAAFMSALTVWIAPEGMFIGTIILAGLLLDNKYEKGFDFARYGTIFAAAFLLINPPEPGILMLDMGRFSLFHVACFAFAALGFDSLRNLKFARSAPILSVLLILFVMTTKEALFKPFVAENIKLGWESMIIQNTSPFRFLFRKETGNTLITLKIGMLAITFLLMGITVLPRIIRKNPYILAAGIGFSIMIIASFFRIRFMPMAVLMSMIVFLEAFPKGKTGGASALLALIFLITSFNPVSKQFSLPSLEFAKEENFEYLNEVDIDGRLLAYNFIGPQIMFQSDVEVLSTPYHSNVYGILSGYEILFAEKDSFALELMREKGVRYILFSSDKYLDLPKHDDETFYGRIMSGKPAAFLEEIKIPSKKYRLWRVKEEIFFTPGQMTA